MRSRTGPDEADRRLSSRISPRAVRPEDNEGLRTLVVNRLSDTHKAVVRLGLRSDKVSVLCEPCGAWSVAPENEFPLEWACPRCAREYRTEFVVMEEVE